MMASNVFLRQLPIFRKYPTLLAQTMAMRTPTEHAARSSATLVMNKPTWDQRASGTSFQRGALMGNKLAALGVRGASTQISETPPSFARHYYLERAWALGMAPLFPAALFIHNPVMDYLLATAIALHIHWGMEGVADDYARPFVIGETMAKLSRYGVYVFSLLMYIGLLHFNYADVGITKAFEMIWSL